MDLRSLFVWLTVAFDADEPIEATARAELIAAAPDVRFDGAGVALPPSMIDIMTVADAHPVCRLLAQMPLDWAQPSTSSDPKYLASGVGRCMRNCWGRMNWCDLTWCVWGYTGCCPTTNTAFAPIRQKRCL